MTNYSRNNGDLRRSDAYLIQQNIYEVRNEQAQVQRYDQQVMIHQLGQTVPAASNQSPDIQYEQEVKALKRIFRTWRRGNSLILNLKDKTCSI